MSILKFLLFSFLTFGFVSKASSKPSACLDLPQPASSDIFPTTLKVFYVKAVYSTFEDTEFGCYHLLVNQTHVRFDIQEPFHRIGTTPTERHLIYEHEEWIMYYQCLSVNETIETSIVVASSYADLGITELEQRLPYWLQFVSLNSFAREQEMETIDGFCAPQKVVDNELLKYEEMELMMLKYDGIVAHVVIGVTLFGTLATRIYNIYLFKEVSLV